MGADDNSILKKCGEILINIKLKSKKTKTYTFKCIFCDGNWDQLKKFSQHLEEKHQQQFSEETDEKSLIFEPEIKLEEHLEGQKKDILKKLTNENPIEDGHEEDVHEEDIHVDPLEPIEFVTTATITANIGHSTDVKVKHEKSEESFHDQYDDDDDECHINNDDMDYEDCAEDKDEDIKLLANKAKTRTNKPRRSTKKCKDLSDISSDYSNESDFDINDKLNISKKPLVIKTKKSHLKSPKKNKKEPKKSDPEPKIYSESEKELIIALFDVYAKETYLWKDHERKRITDKSIFPKAFETIAYEVNEKLGTNITGDLAKDRINEMRIKYSHELEKQQNGEPHHIPWYSEHMQFLDKNIDAAIKSRQRKKKEKLKPKLAELDDAQFLILIELYKKNEGLWQINNIAFGIGEKRDEIFNNMIKDLKSNYAIDMTTDILHDYIKYINSIYTKDKELQLKCELATTEFKPSSEYYKEMSFLNESQGPFKCDTCNEIIKRFETYYQHVANHTNAIPFKCSLCEMGFKRFDTYIMHAKRHLGIYKFQCNVCGKKYPSKFGLDFHLTSHTGVRPYLCQHCGASFRIRHDYDNHVRRHEKRFRYECHICKLGFNHLHHLNEHVRSHLDIRDHICNICGKAFTALRYLKNHKLIHDNTKRYKCNVCGKEFSQTAGLRQHRKQHQPHLTAAEIKRKKEDIEGLSDVFNL